MCFKPSYLCKSIESAVNVKGQGKSYKIMHIFILFCYFIVGPAAINSPLAKLNERQDHYISNCSIIFQLSALFQRFLNYTYKIIL